jgi:hypothetical protein
MADEHTELSLKVDEAKSFFLPQRSGARGFG